MAVVEVLEVARAAMAKRAVGETVAVTQAAATRAVATWVTVKAVEDAEVAVGMEVEPEAALAALRVAEAGEEAQLAA